MSGITGESAKRAALSGGATVADLIAVDDGRQDFERVSDLRRHEIAMVVMAGGVDEEIFKSGKHQILNVAKVIAEGLPRRRGGEGKVPVVYAASAEGREEVTRIMQDKANIIWADNVRPTLDVEHLESARGAVVSTFLDSVRHDPRFRGLGKLGSPDPLPRGYVLGQAVEGFHRRTGENLIVISLDGDVVQVVSGIRGVFTRTVTPVSNVEHRYLRRHLPAARLAQGSENMLANWKMRPYVLPRTWDELAVLLAIYKEAVRLAMEDHKKSSIELRGIHRQRQISETFQVNVSGGDTLVRMERIGKIIFTGYMSRLLSPASLVSLAADGADPGAVTELFLDVDDALALSGLFHRTGIESRFEDRLRPIGVLVSPGRNEERVSPKRASLERGGAPQLLPVQEESLVRMSIDAPSGFAIVMEPPNNKVDFGEGDGRKVRREISGGNAIYVGRRAGDPKAKHRFRSTEVVPGLARSPREVISMGGEAVMSLVTRKPEVKIWRPRELKLRHRAGRCVT